MAARLALRRALVGRPLKLPETPGMNWPWRLRVTGGLCHGRTGVSGRRDSSVGMAFVLSFREWPIKLRFGGQRARRLTGHVARPKASNLAARSAGDRAGDGYDGCPFSDVEDDAC